MYYQSYEDYLRDLECYRQMPTYNNYYAQYQRNVEIPNDDDVEKLYPDVYKIIYPMVNKACNQHRGKITDDVVSRISNEIYSNLEINEVENDVRIENRNAQATKNTRLESSKTENETRQRRPNNLLRDLVRILVIRELLGGGRRPNRPPFPGRPPYPGRPPLPGRPPFPGGPRPPMPRSDYDGNIDYYNDMY